MNTPNENTKKCPICPRACELSAPHCERGAEYARTGIIPAGAGSMGMTTAMRLGFGLKRESSSLS